MANLAIDAQAQNINFVTKFESDLHNLLAMLGKADVQVMAPGTALKIYKDGGSIGTGTAAEGAEVPAGTAKMTLDSTVILEYKKYRNVVGIESIGSMGYDVAVGGVAETMLRQTQKGVRTDIIAGVKLGTGSTSGATFQPAIANCWAELTAKCEDEAVTPVYFCHPTTAAAYLGSANVTMQTAFGLSYIQNFIGLGTLIVDSNCETGKIYGTASENLVVAAANLAAIPDMEYQTDASGIIGINTGSKYSHAGIEINVACGLKVVPQFLDRIIVATVGA